MSEIKIENTLKNLKISNELQRHILGLMSAYFMGYQIFAVCTKYPRGNLDSGRHYFDLYYYSITTKCMVKFWYDCRNGADIDKLYLKKSEGRYSFGSGSIGSSRLAESFKGLSNILEDLFPGIFYDCPSSFYNFIKVI